MNNLRCRKQGFNKYVCKKTNKEIKLSDCKNCPYKEYKEISNNKQTNIALQNKQRKLQKSVALKKKSNKLTKLEHNRSSLFTEDLNHCIICGRSPVNKHEIFGGRNRLNSIKYKLVIPLCTCQHHNQIDCKGIHFDKKLEDEWHKKGQAIFEKAYPDLKFEDIFRINYLK